MSLFKTVDLVKISSSEKGHYERGRWVDVKNTTQSFKGTWQPDRGQMQELLPQGKRNRETYICYAPISMSFTAYDPQNEDSADLIMWENKIFEVILASKWKNLIIPHWELVCVRKKEGTKIDYSLGSNVDSISTSEEENHDVGK